MKTGFSIAIGIISFGLSVAVVINGWGLSPVSWPWIIFGGAGSILLTAIAVGIGE